MGPVGFPEMSLRTYHYSLRNNPEERGSHFGLVDLGHTGFGGATTAVTECTMCLGLCKAGS